MLPFYLSINLIFITLLLLILHLSSLILFQKMWNIIQMYETIAMNMAHGDNNDDDDDFRTLLLSQEFPM